MTWSGFVESSVPAGPPYYAYDSVAFVSQTVNGTDYACVHSGEPRARPADVQVVDCGNGKVQLQRDDGFVACEEGSWLVFRDPNTSGHNWQITLNWNQNYASLGSYWMAVDGSGFLNLKKSGKWVCFAEAAPGRHFDW